MSTINMLKQVEAVVNNGIDDAIDALKWSKKHRHERKALDTLRLVQANLGYLALALDWEMEGNDTRTAEALGRVWWQPNREMYNSTWDMDGC